MEEGIVNSFNCDTPTNPNIPFVVVSFNKTLTLCVPIESNAYSEVGVISFSSITIVPTSSLPENNCVGSIIVVTL